MKPAAIILIVFICIGCFKEKKTLTGMINISGKITDVENNAPLANIPVQLVGLQQVSGLIGFSPEPTERDITRVLTDAAGNYSLSYNSTGSFYEFAVYAEPNNRSHVSSRYTVGQNNTINQTGNATINLSCHQTAIGKITLTNTSPVDTPYHVGVSSPLESIKLRNFYKDTVVHLKLIGRRTEANKIEFTKTNSDKKSSMLTAGPSDTVTLQFNY